MCENFEATVKALRAELEKKDARITRMRERQMELDLGHPTAAEQLSFWEEMPAKEAM